MCVCKSIWRHINLFFGHTLLHKVPVLFLSLSVLLQLTIFPCLLICLFCTSRELPFERSRAEKNSPSDKARKKAKKIRRWRKSDVCAPALDSFSRGTFRLSLSLCLVLFSLFYFSLCVSGFTLLFLPPFLVSLALYLSLPVSWCVSVTGEDARLLLSPLKMTPLMLASTLTVVAGSETLCFCTRLRVVRGIWGVHVCWSARIL